MNIDELTLGQIKQIQNLGIGGQTEMNLQSENIGKYVICRTYSAGVFAGILKKKFGKEVVLQDARRIWYWKGAASLSQLAMDGTNKPDECKFPKPVDSVEITECIEIIPTTEKAEKSIRGVSEWKQ